MIRPQRAIALWILLATVAACSGRTPLPQPRSIIVYSGARIQPQPQRMAEIEAWLNPELERINLDPDFLIRLTPVAESTYPWETLEITADTAALSLAAAAPDAETPYLVYGYLRLMEDWGTLTEMLPEAEAQSEFGVERAIVQRVAEVWLLGRSVFDTQPFGPLDELVYANDAGYLDHFILATQAERFFEEAEEYHATDPGGEAEFREWFRRTFDADGPQFILPPETEEETEEPAPAQDPPR